jgi:flagellar capping protein FliD
MFTNQIRFGGLFSGMDTHGMVQQMMRAESMRLNRLNQRRQLVEWRQENFRSASDWLRDFQNNYLSILNASRPGNLTSSDMVNSSFNTMRSTVTGPSGNNAGLTVRVGMNAQPGRFEVTVNQPATAASINGTRIGNGEVTGGITPFPPLTLINGTQYNFNITVNNTTANISLTHHFSDPNIGVNLHNRTALTAEINRQLEERFSTVDVTPTVPNPPPRIEVSSDVQGRLTFKSNSHLIDINDTITISNGTTEAAAQGRPARANALPLLNFESGVNNTIRLDQNIIDVIPGFVKPAPVPASMTRRDATQFTPPASWSNVEGWQLHSVQSRQVPATFNVPGVSQPRPVMSFRDANNNNRLVEVVDINPSTDEDAEPMWREVTRTLGGVAERVFPSSPVTVTGAMRVVHNAVHEPVFHQTLTINGANISIFPDDTVRTIMNRINATPGTGVNISYDNHNNRFVMNATTTGIGSKIVINDPTNFLNHIGLDGYTPVPFNMNASANGMGWLDTGANPFPTNPVLRSNTESIGFPHAAWTDSAWTDFGTPHHALGWMLETTTWQPVPATFTRGGETWPVWSVTIPDGSGGEETFEFIQRVPGLNTAPYHFQRVERDEHGVADLIGYPSFMPFAPEEPYTRVENFNHTPIYVSQIIINNQPINIRSHYTIQNIQTVINAAGAAAPPGMGFRMELDPVYNRPTIVFDTPGTVLDINPTTDPGGFLRNMQDELDRVSNSMAAVVPLRTPGQNAKITIDPFTGAGATSSPIIIDSETNHFTFQGHNITLNGARAGDIFTVDTVRDVSDAMDSVRAFVDSYNALILSLHTLHSTPRPRGNDRSFFEPLTQEQREGMSDREIERWEEMARTGLLHRDRTLRDIHQQLRSWMSQGVTLQPGGERVYLHEIGVTTGGGPHELRLIGMLKIDENKLRAALEENPERIMRMFTQPPPAGVAVTTAERNARLPHQGLNGRLNDIIANAISTSGSLFEIAGAANTNNRLTQRMDDYDRRIADMHRRLARRETDLFAMFARMEVAMARSQQQMESLWMFGNQ